MTPRRQTAVVIGGGLGGLAVALRLAAAGRRVIVCEAGPTLGGKMNRWSSDGFVFDTGPSLITMPWVFAELFDAAGSRIDDHLRLERLDPLARYVFADGTAFEYGGEHAGAGWRPSGSSNRRMSPASGRSCTSARASSNCRTRRSSGERHSSRPTARRCGR